MTRLVARQTETSMQSLEKSVLLCVSVCVCVDVHGGPEMSNQQIDTEVSLIQSPDFYAFKPPILS